MFKSFTARAIVPVVLAVTGFVIVSSFLLYSHMKADLINDAVSYETNLADTIIKSTRFAMLGDDREALRNMIDNVGAQQRMEHVRIFNKKGLIMFSEDPQEINRMVDKKAAGCIGCHAGEVPKPRLGAMQQSRRFVNDRGVEVIAITAPIYNEPACFNAACHAHNASNKVLGTLDLGVSSEPLQKALSNMRGRLIVFSFLVLILTIGGVCALLRRNIFVPLNEIIEYTRQLNRGNLNAPAPSHHGELRELIDNIAGIAIKVPEADPETTRPPISE